MKRILYYLFILVLLFPVIDTSLSIASYEKLNGSFLPVKKPVFLVEAWFNNSFQLGEEAYINDYISVKPLLTRINNQIDFSLFNKANNNEGVVGKDGYLYLESYIQNYTGGNYIGDEKIKLKSNLIKEFQDFFQSKNITLLTVFLPSKASFYSEYIPSHYKTMPKSNYSEYINNFDSLKVNYIDLVKYFDEIKDTTSLPLFPKNGLHWTSYGMAIGVDTLIKAIEKYRNVDLPDFSIKMPILMTKEQRPPDFDEELVMNLLFQLERGKMPYPEFKYDTVNKTKPRTLVISDSYYWQVYSQLIPHNVFDWGGFWYYFNTARENKNGRETVTPVSEIDLSTKLLAQDVIVLFASQATLHRFPFGFCEKSKFILMPNNLDSLKQYYKSSINKDSILQIAKKNNTTYENELEKYVTLKAESFINKYYSKNVGVQQIIDQIMASPKLTKYIEEKAKKNNLTFEEMLKMDAEWQYNKLNKKNNK